jgi:hypothetical protein
VRSAGGGSAHTSTVTISARRAAMTSTHHVTTGVRTEPRQFASGVLFAMVVVLGSVGCGPSSPEASPIPIEVLGLLPGEQASLSELLGSDWSFAYVTECTLGNETIDGLPGPIDFGFLPCVDPEREDLSIALFDGSGGLVRWYREFAGPGSLSGWFAPESVWVRNAFDVEYVVEKGGRLESRSDQGS